ncbi:hypothetical protein Gpo141_00001525 [Globisporangium polare]
MTAQRESAASQLHTMLDQAIEELQFLKRQEERSLQCHIKQIEEDFALRLEVFEQQYLAKVADIQCEMQTAIQQQRANAETTILAAAKQLHEKTQTALLPSQGRHDQDNAGDEADSEMSPVEKQKAKLRALEAKLASFSQGSVKRITSELKGGSGLRTISPTRQPEMASHTVSSYQSQPASRASMHTSDHQANGKSWKPTPLSPLRKNQSYWRRGISLEAKTNENDWATAAANASGDSVNRTQKRGESVTKAPSLSSRFLLPEEEQELRHLRNSIGLAKDWMERHH